MSYLEAKSQFERDVLLDDLFFNDHIHVRVSGKHVRALDVGAKGEEMDEGKPTGVNGRASSRSLIQSLLDGLSVYREHGQSERSGDFLAGVFSPLAFIWFVAAVLTQRQELDETREQFADGQAVIDGQMKNIAAQNITSAMQFEKAQEAAKQTYKLNHHQVI